MAIDREEYEERAAIMEFDGGFGRDMAERTAKNLLIGPYKTEDPKEWQKSFDKMLVKMDRF
ncbi:hypothetical protein N9917_02440 [Deltaproteobacteria bacterium]|nr:hypothetical protein [Deltaproteobacteria bacterium]